MEAACNGFKDIVELLISNGAEVNAEVSLKPCAVCQQANTKPNNIFRKHVLLGDLYQN